jgi:hypothetical protein
MHGESQLLSGHDVYAHGSGQPTHKTDADTQGNSLLINVTAGYIQLQLANLIRRKRAKKTNSTVDVHDQNSCQSYSLWPFFLFHTPVPNLP